MTVPLCSRADQADDTHSQRCAVLSLCKSEDALGHSWICFMGTAGQHNYLDFLFLLNLDYYYFLNHANMQLILTLLERLTSMLKSHSFKQK